MSALSEQTGLVGTSTWTEVPCRRFWTPLMKPPIPQLIGLGILLLGTIATIAAGYFHGKMHIETVWHNLHNFA